MGNYLNPGSESFQMALLSQIFIDKSGLIDVTNRYVRTMQRFICVSRPRRFGKSMAADMLAAYYDRNESTAEFFDKLNISKKQSYLQHLNQYDVIKINMQEFLSMTDSVEEMISVLEKRILRELKRKYPEYIDCEQLIFAMQDVFAETRHPFIILIDEWD